MTSLNTKLTKLLLIAILLTGLSHFTNAQEPEKEALDLVVQKFSADFSKGNFKGVMDAIPPKMLEVIATKASMEVDTLKTLMQQGMETSMQGVKFEKMEMSTENLKIEKTETGRLFAMVPSEMIMSGEQFERTEVKTKTLALKDDGKWYLLRLESQKQATIVGEAFPDLKDIKLPDSTKKAL